MAKDLLKYRTGAHERNGNYFLILMKGQVIAPKGPVEKV